MGLPVHCMAVVYFIFEDSAVLVVVSGGGFHLCGSRGLYFLAIVTYAG